MYSKTIFCHTQLGVIGIQNNCAELPKIFHRKINTVTLIPIWFINYSCATKNKTASELPVSSQILTLCTLLKCVLGLRFERKEGEVLLSPPLS